MKRSASIDLSVPRSDATPRGYNVPHSRIYYQISSASVASETPPTGTENSYDETECSGPLHDFARLLDQSLKRVKIAVSPGELRLQRDLKDISREMGLQCACKICCAARNSCSCTSSRSGGGNHGTKLSNINVEDQDPCSQDQKENMCNYCCSAIGKEVSCPCSESRENPLAHPGGKAFTPNPIILEGTQQISHETKYSSNGFINEGTEMSCVEKTMDTENDNVRNMDSRQGVKVTIERDKLDPLRLKVIVGSKESSAVYNQKAKHEHNTDDWIFLIQVPKKYPYEPPVIFKLVAMMSGSNFSSMLSDGNNKHLGEDITDAKMLAAATVTAAATCARLGKSGEFTDSFVKGGYSFQTASVHMEEVVISCSAPHNHSHLRKGSNVQSRMPFSPGISSNMSPSLPQNGAFAVFEEWSPIHRLHDIVLFLARLRTNTEFPCTPLQVRNASNKLSVDDIGNKKSLDGEEINLQTCPAFEEDANDESICGDSMGKIEDHDDNKGNSSQCCSNASQDYFSHESLCDESFENANDQDVTTPLKPKKHEIMFKPNRFDIGFDRYASSFPPTLSCRKRIGTRCASFQNLDSAAKDYFDNIMDTEEINDTFLMSCGPLVSTTDTASKHLPSFLSKAGFGKESIGNFDSLEPKKNFGFPGDHLHTEQWKVEDNSNVQ
eukprot:CAMPEP_0113310984 /NCGR_PEP_ID=MMETSP0010_2-20120614/8408_1 /TAXON_ID=216773 ORGANISM="Corethron hystrix, Strain 308" /NCGR_SAMPLE_ID=MMETSP0010_2 /ASSEMBLY_ACC=CAM_ASM_000155 /LENGTH=665 /DNA_ID=CAMNT_0000166543 /DNA_START=138 /DNA_END=2135 /DNA_ORIENTATION=+ /assembly_acc=CAM_ASM_000155